MKNLIPIAIVTAALSACASSGGSGPLRPLDQSGPIAGRIMQVRLTSPSPQGRTGGFQQLFERGVQSKVGKCATGNAALTLDVELDGFQRANPMMTGLLVGTNRISGTARVRDNTGRVVGEYRIQRAYTSHGAAGLAMMAQAEEQMSSAFGDEVCKQAFSRRG